MQAALYAGHQKDKIQSHAQASLENANHCILAHQVLHLNKPAAKTIAQIPCYSNQHRYIQNTIPNEKTD